MDKTIVGNNAGKVWYALKEIGEISIPELARRLNLSVESTALFPTIVLSMAIFINNSVTI